MMGRLFSRDVLGIAEPRVGLLSIGEEEAKGSELVLAAHGLLRGHPRVRRQRRGPRHLGRRRWTSW